MKKDFIKLFKEKTDILLSKKQIKIIFSKRKNILVLAAAGSGKTLTIKAKIFYLINVLKVKESSILCISFTNDSVNSLKQSLKGYNIDILTFHKLALKIIGKKYEILEDDMIYNIVNKSFNNDLLLGLYNISKDKMINLIVTFINKFKSLNYDIKDFQKIIKKAKNDDKRLLKEILKCYICYESYLKKENLIDFNDMINYAIKKIDYVNLNYKYIIIDEYQDISYTKFLLINKIRKKYNCNFFAVGDDFQSIYGFTGSNLDVIINFRKYVFISKIFKLNITYRNSLELSKISEKFILKNKNQIKKKIKSNKNVKNPVIIVYYENLNESMKKVIKEYKINDLFILSRNNYDLKNINLENINYKKLTVHKSKGLEEKFVFLINVNNNINGFPNKIKNHEILKYVSKNKNTYYEERRLFYVALTRCEEKIFIFAPINNPSMFVIEVQKYKNVITCKK